MTVNPNLHSPGLMDEARIEDAVEAALEAFWAAIVDKYPEIKSGDFDPMLEGAMYEQAQLWLEHWLSVNAGSGCFLQKQAV